MHRANEFGGGFNPLMQCNPHVCFAIFWVIIQAVARINIDQT